MNDSSILDSTFNLRGRSALVTGASRGLGFHFARVLAQAGAQVTMLSRGGDTLEAAARKLKDQALSVCSVSADVRDPGAVRQAFEFAERQHGPVSVVVNSAGVFEWNETLDFTERQWDEVLGVNLKGTWLVAQAAIKRMLEHRIPGSLINISSLLASRAPLGTDHAYPASKAGVEQLTRTLATEFAKSGIRVNCIAPGWFPTTLNQAFLESEPGRQLIESRVPMGRTGRHSELDGALLLLASEASSYLTGHILHVDGGLATGNI